MDEIISEFLRMLFYSLAGTIAGTLSLYMVFRLDKKDSQASGVQAFFMAIVAFIGLPSVLMLVCSILIYGVSAATYEPNFTEAIQSEPPVPFVTVQTVELNQYDKVQLIVDNQIKLEKIIDEYLPLFDGLPKPPIEVTQEPIKFGRHLLAYAQVVRGKGHYDCRITIKLETLTTHPEDIIRNTVKHEMTHCWTGWKDITEGEHGEEFMKKLTSVGGHFNHSNL